MRLTIQDGARQVTITDRKTHYSAETLTEWAKTAGSLLASTEYPPVSSHPTALVEKAAQFDHDTKQPIGFASAR